METLNSVTVWSVAVVSLLVALNYLSQRDHDRQEPALAPEGIPLVGHIFGFIRHGSRYYEYLSGKLHLPIFTISMPSTKIYVVTKPELIARLDKHDTTISFAPIVSQFSKAICGTSQEGMDILNDNIFGQHGEGGLLNDISAAMRHTLQPGTFLDDMNRVMAREVCEALDRLRPTSKGSFNAVKLFEMVSDVATMATTDAVYGPGNPFKSKSVQGSFCTFENGMVAMLVSPFPAYTAKKPIASREEVAKSFDTYFTQRQFEHGSELVKARHRQYAQHHLPTLDIARFEVGNAIALLVNTIPTLFWTLLTIHTEPGLLASIREELDAILKTDPTSGITTIDIATVKCKCPLLGSTLRETLRCRAVGTVTRKIISDTIVDGYLMKKDALVQYPIPVVHKDHTHWGPDAGSFTSTRFSQNFRTPGDDTKRQPAEIAYRSFGGGKHLCPGRFFATYETLAFVSLFVSRYEMRPARGGEWKVPSTLNSNAVGQVATPDFDLEVEVLERCGFGGRVWNVEMTPEADGE